MTVKNKFFVFIQQTKKRELIGSPLGILRNLGKRRAVEGLELTHPRIVSPFRTKEKRENKERVKKISLKYLCIGGF